MNKLTELGKKMKSQKFYEQFFFIIILGSLGFWLFEIFYLGDESLQLDMFFLRMWDFFADTTNVVGYASERNVYECLRYSGLGEKAYPPLTYMIMYFFSRLVDMEHYYEQDYFLTMYEEPLFLFFLILTMIFWSILIYEIVRTNKNGSTATKLLFSASILCSYPILYSLERANTIVPTAFFIAFYLLYYDSTDKKMKELALVSLAIAVALKMTPAILGLLLLYKKDWKSSLRAILYGIIVGIGPFFFFEGGLNNLFKMFRNMQYNLNLYPSTDGCTLLASFMTFGIPYSETLNLVCKLLTFTICVLFILCIPLLKTKWEQILAITIILLILPSHSGTYCIIYLIPACLLFMNEKEHKLSELALLIGYSLVFYTYQSGWRNTVLNHNMSIVIFTIFISVRCIIALRNRIKKVTPHINAN